MRPTGNWRPAFAERLTAFLAVLPLPRPDMVVVDGWWKGGGGACGEWRAAAGRAAPASQQRAREPSCRQSRPRVLANGRAACGRPISARACSGGTPATWLTVTAGGRRARRAAPFPRRSSSPPPLSLSTNGAQGQGRQEARRGEDRQDGGEEGHQEARQGAFARPAGRPAKRTRRAGRRADARRAAQTESYKIYIYKVLKQVHPDTGISSKAMSIMCVLVFAAPPPPPPLPQRPAPPLTRRPPRRAPQELVHQRHLREDRHRGGQAGALQQEADGDVPRDSDGRAPHPAWRAGQARRVGGHQVRALRTQQRRAPRRARARPRGRHASCN